MSDQVAEMSAAYLVEAAQDAVPKGYKKTDVGVIPADWAVSTIAEKYMLATGSTPPTADSTNYGEGHLFASPADLGHKKYITKTQKQLSEKGFWLARKFPAGSILFTCIGSTIGKTGLTKTELTSNQQINAIFPNENSDIEFTYYAITYIAPKIKALAGHQAVPLINKSEFGATQFCFPNDIKEQTSISNALSDVDALISELEKLIAKKQAIKTATMQQLLTGRTRLPQFALREDGTPKGYKQSELGEIPEDWQVRCLGNFAIYLGSGKTNTKSKGDFPLYGSTGLIGSSKNPEYNGEAILVARVGANAGKLNFVSGKYGVSDNTIIIKFNTNSDVHFFRYLMIRKNLNTLVFGSGQPLITGSQLKELLFSLPPKEEQVAISTILFDMDEEIQALEQHLGKTRQIKQGMMQELLTGKTRLPKGDSND